MIAWSDFYLFCFAFGFLFSLVSVVLAHFPGGHDWHAHPHHGHGPHGHLAHPHLHHHGAANGGHAVSPVNPGTVAAFLAWFGGVGYLSTRFYAAWVYTSIALALAAGLAGAWAVFRFLTGVLMREREELDPADYDMVGVLGTVSGNIRIDGIGEILFSQAGTRRAAPARSDNAGEAIPAGTEVVVTRYENGIAYVQRWDQLAPGAGAATIAPPPNGR